MAIDFALQQMREHGCGERPCRHNAAYAVLNDYQRDCQPSPIAINRHCATRWR